METTKRYLDRPVSSCLYGTAMATAMERYDTLYYTKDCGISPQYVNEACWIGFYVYRDLEKQLGRHYGIPNNLKNNGILPRGGGVNRMCRTTTSDDGECRSLRKTFYRQYQFLPFLVAAIGLLYYLPYHVFRYVNVDLIRLDNDDDATMFLDTYFNNTTNDRFIGRMRIVESVLIKLLYIGASLIAFTGIDSTMNGDFKRYGRDWLSGHGQLLLPPFGICEVLKLEKYKRHIIWNRYELVCEISQHVLRQYVFLVFWYFIVSGLVVSALGLLFLAIDYARLTYVVTARRWKYHTPITVRQYQYLERVREKSLAAYENTMKRLRDGEMRRRDMDHLVSFV